MKKKDEVLHFARKMLDRGLNEIAANNGDRVLAEAVVKNKSYLLTALGKAFYDDYAFLELGDIMQWKRTRSRR